SRTNGPASMTGVERKTCPRYTPHSAEGLTKKMKIEFFVHFPLFRAIFEGNNGREPSFRLRNRPVLRWRQDVPGPEPPCHRAHDGRRFGESATRSEFLPKA